MATTPPSGSTEQAGGTRGYGYTGGGGSPLTGMPLPFNSELVLYLLIEIIFTILWWVRDEINTQIWMSVTAAVTVGYLISRGIAKASRVVEH